MTGRTQVLVRAAVGCVLGATLGIVAGAAEPADSAARVVAVGDVHGDFDALVRVLRDAGLVDEKTRWVGGRARLVQTGDRLDRGASSRKVMDLLMRLEKEARKAGGAVHPLLGNHEVMNVLGDLRYTVPGEFAAFAGPDSRGQRDELLAQTEEQRRREKKPPLTPGERQEWEAQRPLGYVEHRRAFLPDGPYGSWIARQDAVLRIGDTLFLHGGIAPKYADFALDTLNDRIRAEIKEASPMAAVVANDQEGPLWFRGLAQGDPALATHLEEVLRRHGCRRMVVGHTPTEGLVFPRYGGRLVQIDVGLARFYGGPPAALLIEGGAAFALHRGRRVPLPEGDGEPVLRYVREVAALEPDPARLAGVVARLETALTATAPR